MHAIRKLFHLNGQIHCFKVPSPRTSWHSNHSSPPSTLTQNRNGHNREKAILEAEMQRQQKLSQADSEWLRNSEKNMGVPRRQQTPPPNVNTSPRTPSPKVDLDRTDDEVYRTTTNVVRCVMAMSKEVTQNKSADYVELVKSLGVELRAQLASVDTLMSSLPPDSHDNIEMAHKVLGSDMGKLITAMRSAQKYLHTTMSEEYKKIMLQSAHALAMDAKTLLDTVDSGRIMLLEDNIGK